MPVTGIIAEFNPLHKGHEYVIKQAAKNGGVVCVISGNFVQRGEAAVAEKRIRARSALLAGADLVLELPVLWSMSTAQNFALGAVSILDSIGCDSLLFGSESGDSEALIKTSKIVSSEEFSKRLRVHLDKGLTFATARQYAATELGACEEILAGANNNLAVEYISAAKKIGSEMNFQTVKRIGANHDSLEEAEFVSASLLRQRLRDGDAEFCKKYISPNILGLFSKENITNMGLGDRCILSRLRCMSAEEIGKIPDLSEGVENKLFSAIRIAKSVEELCDEIKVKRYTLARIRRMVLSAFIGADNEYFMKTPPYIRVLGFNQKGSEILRKGTKASKVPVVAKASDIISLGKGANKVFETECRATDLFSMFLEKPLECGLEYTSKVIKIE